MRLPVLRRSLLRRLGALFLKGFLWGRRHFRGLCAGEELLLAQILLVRQGQQSRRRIDLHL